MGRTPNLKISQWFKQGGVFLEGWEDLANCRGRHDLPWTPNFRPSFEDQRAMADVCSDCPVMAKCAQRGLGAVGGFYAGVWIPWKTLTPDTDDTRAIRIHGRRKLKVLADESERCEA
jgi:hypothetical protein